MNTEPATRSEPAPPAAAAHPVVRRHGARAAMRRVFRLLGIALVFSIAPPAHASIGLMEMSGNAAEDTVTTFYPSRSESLPLSRGPFTIHVAENGDPARGNGRLIVMSHGSGASPWVYFDLAAILVEAGFVVAIPQHAGDNDRNPSTPGPESWKRRPREISRAIDVIAHDARLAPLLAFDKVGLYGMSAGGHTALSLAGGRWSEARLKQHCDAHLAEDFQACVGLASTLTGGPLDGLRKRLARWIIDRKWTDATWQTYHDPRIAAVVAGVPFAADFDPASLRSPRVPLAIVTARQDKWLRPEFHSDAILRACHPCEHLADFPRGGHGALLSPLPPGLSGLIAELIGDPPGFDRSETQSMNRKITVFFQRHLLPVSEAIDPSPASAGEHR